MSKPIEMDGDGDDFTIFLFSNKPKKTKYNKIRRTFKRKTYWITYFRTIITNICGWFKVFLWLCGRGNEGKVDINELTEENIKLMKQYF